MQRCFVFLFFFLGSILFLSIQSAARMVLNTNSRIGQNVNVLNRASPTLADSAERLSLESGSSLRISSATSRIAKKLSPFCIMNDIETGLGKKMNATKCCGEEAPYPYYVGGRTPFQNEVTEDRRIISGIGEKVSDLRGVKCVYQIFSDFDLLVHICCATNNDIDNAIKTIGQIDGVSKVTKMSVYKKIKEDFRVQI